LRAIGKQPVHLLRGFEISLAVGEELEPGLVDRAPVADASERILEHPPAGVVVVDVVGGQ